MVEGEDGLLRKHQSNAYCSHPMLPGRRRWAFFKNARSIYRSASSRRRSSSALSDPITAVCSVSLRALNAQHASPGRPVMGASKR